jgi:hypothetical protein
MDAAPSLFRIGPTSNMGQGWFATRDIPNESEILNESLILRWSAKFDTVAGLEVAVSKLPDEHREIFLSLSGASAMDKLQTNCASLVDPKDLLGTDPRTEVGVFSQCARLNHSCLANSITRNDLTRLHVTVLSSKWCLSSVPLVKCFVNKFRIQTPARSPAWSKRSFQD